MNLFLLLLSGCGINPCDWDPYNCMTDEIKAPKTNDVEPEPLVNEATEGGEEIQQGVDEYVAEEPKKEKESQEVKYNGLWKYR